MPKQYLNYINGKFEAAASGKYVDSVNPATAEVCSRVPDSDSRDAQKAIKAAEAALPAWRKSAVKERVVLMRKVAAEMTRRAEEFAQAEAEDMGKPLMLSRGDVAGAIEHWETFAALISTSTTPYIQTEENVIMEHRNAIGVVGLITPWNFPLFLFTTKVAACMACGNTSIVKPSEMSPNTAAMMCEVFAKVGIPNGVINVIHGYGPKAAQPIVESDVVRAISFTGGSATGRIISRIAAPKLKKLQLELGGKNSSIVFADCYFDETVEGVAQAGFFNTGQVCCSGSRVLVDRKILPRFVQALKKHVRDVWRSQIGDPRKEETLMGPLVSSQHFEKVCSYLKLAKQEGGVVLGGRAGGDALGLSGALRRGYFVEPTIVLDLDHTARCGTEEIFGPVITIHPFDSEKEAIQIANEVQYGLAGSVWTSDIRRGQRVARQIQAGTMWINTYLTMDPRQPFGGFKDSGVGRENGMHSINFFTEIKAIVSKL